MIRLGMILAAAIAISAAGGAGFAKMAMQTFPVLAGAGPHDVYPAPDGTVWFIAQSAGKLGRLDPNTGKSNLIAGCGASRRDRRAGRCRLGHPGLSRTNQVRDALLQIERRIRMPVQRFAPMTKDFATFDCDAHVTEPPLIWERAKDFLTSDELDALKRTIWWDADGRLLIVNGRAGIGLGSPRRGGIPGTMRVITNAGPGVKHDIQRALNVRNLT